MSAWVEPLSLAIEEFSGHSNRVTLAFCLRSGSHVPEAPWPPLYAEPTVLWRMWRADGRSIHAVIDLSSSRPTLVWYLDDRPLGSRDFDDCTSALRWSDQLQTQNWAVGWRAVSD